MQPEVTSRRVKDAPAARALIADDESEVSRMVARSLAPLGLAITTVSDGKQAIACLEKQTFDVVISDWSMPRAGGLAVLEASRRLQPAAAVLIVTGQGGIHDCVDAMRAGAFDFLSKPFRADTLCARVEAAIGARRRPGESRKTSMTAAGAPVVGRSTALAAVFALVDRVGPTDATVLISGETGSGKEVVARLVHTVSARSAAPFVTVNCGALPPTLIESELFGHVRGAFTGAADSRPGLIREAHEGTLFLDELGELPLAMQTRLLRVLQERQVTPVGADRPFPIDVRFLAATNRNLAAMVADGSFRQDLYFRLNVVPITVPPLRERVEDIPDLVTHFLTRYGERSGRKLEASAGAVALLQLHSWPGNIRELENVLQRAAILATGCVIEPTDLGIPVSPRAASHVAAAAGALEAGKIDLPATVARFEWTLIDQALAHSEGNRARAAAMLGISRTTLVDKLKRRA
jgi:two-component system, NtrC family, response regulator AtoC